MMRPYMYINAQLTVMLNEIHYDQFTMYSTGIYPYVYRCTCKYCKHIVNKYLDCDIMLVYFCVNISTYLAFVTRAY